MILSPRSEAISRLIQAEYTLLDLVAVEQVLQPATEISLNALDRVVASNRSQEGEDSSHYDAVWVRDSVWAYLGLHANENTKNEAKAVLTGMLDYFSTPEQLRRLDRVIAHPALVNSANGAMEVLHIRFDGRSPGFRDVQVEGRDQKWNHKQNDAVGLVALTVGEALWTSNWTASDVPDKAWEFLLRLPSYWQAVGYENQEDAGAWEEIERCNSSSVGIVTRSLEIWDKLARDPAWSGFFLQKAKRLGLNIEKETFFNQGLSGLIDRGYTRLFKQLPYESPDYEPRSSKHRKADAALLNLIYPADLSRFETVHRRKVLEVVETLVRDMGILRYEGDAYQSGNYWVGAAEIGNAAPLTDDHSGEAAFASRAGRFIPGTEAQWFFDSWVSRCFGVLYQDSGEEADFKKQVLYFNRALCQITGNEDLGADGKPVASFSLPESYNTLVGADGKRRLVPSPITPLNWSKACLTLALESLKQSLKLKYS